MRSKRPAALGPSPRANAKPGSMPMPRRIALVARDWLREEKRGPGRFDAIDGFSPHTSDIVRAANRVGAELIVFSLWSHDVRTAGVLSSSDLFPRGTTHQAVVLEVIGRDTDYGQIHLRQKREPIQLIQKFGRSADAARTKTALLKELPARKFGSSLLLLCGETNIIRTKRRSKKVEDRFDFRAKLKELGIKLIVNPVHDYMRRPEMKTKRAILSEDVGLVVSVWNRGNKDREAEAPWTAHLDGEDISARIEEKTAIPSQPGIRMGLLDVPI
jgi:hypothetical protein